MSRGYLDPESSADRYSCLCQISADPYPVKVSRGILFEEGREHASVKDARHVIIVQHGERKGSHFEQGWILSMLYAPGVLSAQA